MNCLCLSTLGRWKRRIIPRFSASNVKSSPPNQHVSRCSASINLWSPHQGAHCGPEHTEYLILHATGYSQGHSCLKVSKTDDFIIYLNRSKSNMKCMSRKTWHWKRNLVSRSILERTGSPNFSLCQQTRHIFCKRLQFFCLTILSCVVVVNFIGQFISSWTKYLTQSVYYQVSHPVIYSTIAWLPVHSPDGSA